MSKFVGVASLTLSVLVGLGACTKGPSQYVTNSPAAVSAKENLKNKYPLPDPLTPEEIKRNEDEISRANSREDIIYGVGAGGLKLTNTLEESEKILSKPLILRADGLAAYASGLYIFWRTQDPRTPEMIIVTGAYQGKMNVGGEVGELRMGTDLTKFFTQSSPTGEDFVRAAHQILENKPAGYDCLAEKTCELTPTTNFILYKVSAKLLLLVSTDRHIVSEIRLVDSSDMGPLNKNFELSELKFIAPDGSEFLGLGDTFDTVSNLVQTKPKTTTSTRSFVKEYGGIYLVFSRSKLDESYIEPELGESLKEVAFTGDYQKPFLISGEFVKITQDDQGLKVAKTEFEPKKDEFQLLSLTTEIKEANHKAFLTELGSLFQKELKAKYNLTGSLVSGLNSQEFDRSYDLAAVGYDEASKKGQIISVRLRQLKGTVTQVGVSRLSEQADQVTAPDLLKDFHAAKNGPTTDFAGFSIGEVVEVTNRNAVKKQATFASEKIDKTSAPYAAQDTQVGIYTDDGKSVIDSVQAVAVGELGVALSIVPVPDEADKFVVVGVSTSSFLGKIQELCGMTLTLGMKDSDVKGLVAASGCKTFPVRTTDGRNNLKTLYFPDQRIRLDFSARELSGIGIYARPSEVLK